MFHSFPVASTSTQIILKSEPHSYFHVPANISFIRGAMHPVHMYYVPGFMLGDGDTKVNEAWTWTPAFNIFKSGGGDRQVNI